MNLYKISQDENTGYDTYDSAIVAATSGVVAITIRPDGEPGNAFVLNSRWDSTRGTWATSPENVKVEYIGKAKPGTKQGVIVSSFNAG